MTQKQKILTLLEFRGSSGVRSDEFYAMYLPRAAARIQELREEGKDIVSEREGKFVRYVYVGVESGERASRSHQARKSASPTLDSGAGSLDLPPSPSAAPARSMYDVWEEA